MKKIISIFLILMTFFILGCIGENDKQIIVYIDLDIYEELTKGNRMTFTYYETIEIESTYEVTSIEQLTNDYGEFPYESVLIDEKDYSKYVSGLKLYLDQISETTISESISYMLISKPKLLITLSNGNSDIFINFYQNSNNSITGSAIAYKNYKDVDFIHYFRDDPAIDYKEINIMI